MRAAMPGSAGAPGAQAVRGLVPAKAGALAVGAHSDAAPARANAPGKFDRRDLVIGSKDSLAAAVCASFVLIFPGCRCDENDTLTIERRCNGDISGTVAIGGTGHSAVLHP